MLTEINVDGLVGPTHHFGGLGVGNTASIEHAHRTSYPRRAALQGLAKAALLHRLGVPQFLLLPPARPRLELLTALGYRGTLQQQLTEAWESAPLVLSAVFSSAFMWAANSATVTPAVDSEDSRLHITPANLISSLHRAGEATERHADLQELLGRVPAAVVHDPLPACLALRDEGAANHMRLCDSSGKNGVHLFVYGEATVQREEESPARFFPRQAQLASQAIASRHRLPSSRVMLLRQHPDSISAGVFHNDVIATSHQDLLIHHEHAFCDSAVRLPEIERMFQQATGGPLRRVEVSGEELPLNDAVSSYFFNSQIVSPGSACDRGAAPRMLIVCPTQCRDNQNANRLIERLLADPEVPIEQVEFIDLAESMAGGGGPACLRLRVLLESDCMEQLQDFQRLGERREETIARAIERWYPEKLDVIDFCNAELVECLSVVPGELRHSLRSL